MVKLHVDKLTTGQTVCTVMHSWGRGVLFQIEPWRRSVQWSSASFLAKGLEFAA
ncbi:hypothetical protein [Mycobacteroides abscessus]|uniref:hypothetical protein n=1 Tax=Mycobacteroides abscessus TaxID=36809 RepID=UPI0009C7E7CD|nr:hypothetical protein [Mycobacteroides abscessus]SLL18392.1 Uncharacterised protein [Mycobacteroides abscessus subsp. abscessus]